MLVSLITLPGVARLPVGIGVWGCLTRRIEVRVAIGTALPGLFVSGDRPHRRGGAVHQAASAQMPSSGDNGRSRPAALDAGVGLAVLFAPAEPSSTGAKPQPTDARIG
jgi:hypothetical protein